MRPRLLLTINCKFAVDFFARGLHTRTAVARLALRQLGFLVIGMVCVFHTLKCVIFKPQNTKTRLTAGLRLDPLWTFYSVPQNPELN